MPRRLMETLGTLDLVPPERPVAGDGAAYLMAPFTHGSRDRSSRFSDGTYGVLCVAETFETALFKTVHHHIRFMARTNEAPGWTSQFRELVLDIDAALHDLRGAVPDFSAALDPDSYAKSQPLAAELRRLGSDGLVYPSQRYEGGDCAGFFYPDKASSVIQRSHLDYHRDGARVDMYCDAGNGSIYRIG